MYVKHFSKFPCRTIFYKQKKRKYIFFTWNKYFVHPNMKINSYLYHKNIHKNYNPIYKVTSPLIYKKKITHVNNIQSVDMKGKKKNLDGYKQIDKKERNINKINIMHNIGSIKYINKINNSNNIYIINKRLFNNDIKYIYSKKKKKKKIYPSNYFKKKNMRQITKILFLQKYTNILQTKKYIIKSIIKHNKIKYHHHINALYKLSNLNYKTDFLLSLNDKYRMKEEHEKNIQQIDISKMEIKQKNINTECRQYNKSYSNNNKNNSNNKYDHQHYNKLSEKMIEEKIHDKNEMNIKINDLLLVALSGCIPFICFGFVDNSFMIISGDLFDSSFCTYLGFSTMAAAGLGNLTSDVLGIFIGGYIEKIIVYIGFPRINLTNKQLKMNRTRKYYYTGSALGIAIGCLLGMIPLLFIDNNKLEERKNQEKKKKKKKFSYYKSNDHYINIANYISKQLPKYIHSKYAFLFIPDYNNKTFVSIYNNKLFHTSLNLGLISHVYQNKKTINYQRNDKNINNNVSNIFKYKHNDDITNTINSTYHNNINIYDDICVENIVNSTDIIIDKNKIDIKQFLAVPLFSIDGKVEAVIAVINSEDKLSFNHNDVVFLNMFSSHLSYDLENEEDLSDMLRLCKNIVYN
ncbi:conserved protein, unknown function [Plasmodium gaboni]|uniref:GAF domain-containing protein n=1 Tax=Plasmodium gaboni TaxID=647221 RepID=A0A151LJC3_9APIC|nr:conserved protein, unknown function [Plasmodium gaboni]KYN99088.1 conserved protein, unknown function [Plasmodium gaboni]